MKKLMMLWVICVRCAFLAVLFLGGLYSAEGRDGTDVPDMVHPFYQSLKNLQDISKSAPVSKVCQRWKKTDVLFSVTGGVWPDAAEVRKGHFFQEARAMLKKKVSAAEDIIAQIDADTRRLAKKQGVRAWFVDADKQTVSQRLLKAMGTQDVRCELWARCVLKDTIEVKNQSPLEFWKSEKGFVWVRNYGASVFDELIKKDLEYPTVCPTPVSNFVDVLWRSWCVYARAWEVHVDRECLGAQVAYLPLPAEETVSLVQYLVFASGSQSLTPVQPDGASGLRRCFGLVACWKKQPTFIANCIHNVHFSRYVFLFNTLFKSVNGKELAYEVFMQALFACAQKLYQDSGRRREVAQFFVMVFHATHVFMMFPNTQVECPEAFRPVFSFVGDECFRSWCLGDIIRDLSDEEEIRVDSVLQRWGKRFFQYISDALEGEIQKKNLEKETQDLTLKHLGCAHSCMDMSLAAQFLLSVRQSIPVSGEKSFEDKKLGTFSAISCRDLEALSRPINQVFAVSSPFPVVSIFPNTPQKTAVIITPELDILEKGGERMVSEVRGVTKFLFCRGMPQGGNPSLYAWQDVKHFVALLNQDQNILS